MRAAAAVALVLALQAGPGSDPRARFHSAIDPPIDALWAGFDTTLALDHVRFLSRFWRLPGNEGYDASLDRIQDRLTRATATGPGAGGMARYAPTVVVTDGPPVRTWTHDIGTVGIVRDGAPDDVVLSREKDRLALCINSFPTPPAGVTARLVDVGRGDRDEDYSGRDVKGAVVLGDADAGQIWRRAVVTGGAIGVISSALPRYISPDPPGSPATPRDEWDILQWGSIPYDEARKGFGFKASPRAAARLRAALREAAQTPGGATTVRITIASTFATRPVRTLVAEIPGSVAPAERIVVAAHVQEPGANDNASGVATLAEMVVALSRAIGRKQIAPPGRTLTFLFLDEISGSRRWLQDNAEAAKQVKYMFSLDMTGEDVAKTGGSFLVERYPDPGAVWDRPWDPHSEWGRGNVRAEQLRGDLINDAHLEVAARVARKSGWVVKSNPYEGGSDHTVFQSAGIPSVLDWHFTDRYYHTNFDTPDKTSAAEMRNVAVAVGATAWLFASATEATAMDVAHVVAAAGQARIAVEETEGVKLAAADPDPAAARAREATIVAAWRKWYGEAVRSAARLVVGQATAAFTATVEELARTFDTAGLVEIAGGGPNHQGGPFVDAADQRQEIRQAETPVFRCGQDQVRPYEIPLLWENVVLAIDGRLYAPCPVGDHSTHREAQERSLLARARAAQDAEFRRLAAIGDGRLNRLPSALSQRDVRAVRIAAAVATADAATAPPAASRLGQELEPPPARTDIVRAARTRFEGWLAVEPDPGVVGVVLEGLGRLPYQTDAERTEIERIIVKHAAGEPAQQYGAAKGLEALIRGNVKRQIDSGTRALLRRMTTVGSRNFPAPTIAGVDTAPAPGPADWQSRTRLVALTALNAIRDDDVLTLTEAARDPEWQVQRLVAQRMDAARPELAAIMNLLSSSPAPQVRYELVGPVARAANASKDCGSLVKYLDDRSPMVVLRTLDVLPDECTGEESLVEMLAAWAGNLLLPAEVERWHRPTRAMSALARIRPAAAAPFLPTAAEHLYWQVRAAAVGAAERLKDEDMVARLLDDRHPNVRTAALQSLRRLNSARLWPAAIAALSHEDHQLLMTAATLLEKAPADVREEASTALLGALRRLTDGAKDTSRDPRVAIVERLGELLAPERASELLVVVDDFDPRVAAAASRAFMRLTGALDPPRSTPFVRYPSQPAPSELTNLPTRASIRIKDIGMMEVELYPGEAPVTVARFAALARSGYYDGLTFHRVVPNFVIQGGSPGANEYAGIDRYMRDELGALPHLRGSLGISTRGRDTGDGQLFIDLVDVPRLDHEYTVFGRLISGYDVLDRILEGAIIERITLK